MNVDNSTLDAGFVLAGLLRQHEGHPYCQLDSGRWVCPECLANGKPAKSLTESGQSQLTSGNYNQSCMTKRLGMESTMVNHCRKENTGWFCQTSMEQGFLSQAVHYPHWVSLESTSSVSMNRLDELGGQQQPEKKLLIWRMSHIRRLGHWALCHRMERQMRSCGRGCSQRSSFQTRRSVLWANTIIIASDYYSCFTIRSGNMELDTVLMSGEGIIVVTEHCYSSPFVRVC